jgi:hypothetical protein
MKTLFKWLILVLALVFHLETNAKTIGLRIPATSGTEGSYINVPINADTSFTGENVIAFELGLTFNTSIFTLDTIVTTGTLTASWTNFLLDRSASGKVRIVAANATALSGTGVLFYLRLYAKSYGSSYINFDATSTILNEGNPGTKLTNGLIQIAAKPKIAVSPNSGTITTGDKLQFSVSGGTSPYTWSVSNPAVASISTTGLLTATAKGFTRVIAVDNSGIRDTSDLSVEIRGLKLYMRDTSIFESHTLLLPIYTTDLTVLNIKAGSVTVTFNANLNATGVIKAGTILNAATDVQFSTLPGSNQCTFSFAGSVSLSGSGILCYISFDAPAGSGGYTSVNLTDAIFNEDILANKQACTVNVKTLPILSISPSVTTLQVGSTQQFTAGNGTAPYTWSTSNTALATIASDGTLTVLKSGMVKVLVEDVYGAKGSTGFINLVAAHLSIHDTAVSRDVPLNIPVWLENYVSGNDLYSYQLDIEFDTTRVTFIGVDKTGSLSNNWSVAGNQVANQYKIAAANTQAISSNGVLIYLQVQLKNMAMSQTTLFKINNIVLNEGVPLATSHNGNLQNTTPTLAHSLVDQSLFRMYPNPNNGSFTFSNSGNKNLRVEIVNLRGAVVAAFSKPAWGTQHVNLKVPAGEYIVIIHSGEGQIFRRKLIVVK